MGFHAVDAQKLSDYKYLYIPQDFKDFQHNQFELNSTLVKNLKTKGYEVIQTENRLWPEELKQEPCKVAVINVIKSGNMFKTKLTLEAKDCNGKVLISQQGASDEKDYETGYNEALQNILKSFPNSAPLFKFSEVKAIFVEKKESTVVKAEEINKSRSVVQPKSDPKTVSNNVENYTNGKVMLQKVIIGKGKFILINKNSSDPFATFSESTKEGIYRVVLENSLLTLGYVENGNYVIEIPVKDGSFRKEIFERK